MNPVMSSYPCESSFLQRIVHLGTIPFNPYATFMFKDWALFAYQLNSYGNLLIMLIAPRQVSVPIDLG